MYEHLCTHMGNSEDEPQVLLPCLRQCLSLGPEVQQFMRLAGHQAPGICLSPIPKHQVYNHGPPNRVLIFVLVYINSGLRPLKASTLLTKLSLPLLSGLSLIHDSSERASALELGLQCSVTAQGSFSFSRLTLHSPL